MPILTVFIHFYDNSSCRNEEFIDATVLLRTQDQTASNERLTRWSKTVLQIKLFDPTDREFDRDVKRYVCKFLSIYDTVHLNTAMLNHDEVSHTVEVDGFLRSHRRCMIENTLDLLTTSVIEVMHSRRWFYNRRRLLRLYAEHADAAIFAESVGNLVRIDPDRQITGAVPDKERQRQAGVDTRRFY